ncbi:Uncharacterised protein [Mycobacteroides abscessus subsp. abscessus]|nr:Uncharacterised protein [Mycobacteroides abscessus subsp. abscessus]
MEKLAQFLHGHVLLRARHGGGDRLIELVIQNRLRAIGSRVLNHQLVEGATHIQHHCVQLALEALDLHLLRGRTPCSAR